MTDVRMQNLIADVTEAMIEGEPTNVDVLRVRYGVSRAEATELVELVEQLHHSMTEVEPTPQFRRQLKQDLLGEAETVTLWRIWRQPARVQVATVAVLISGFFLLVRRLFFGGTASDKAQDDSALRENA
jgi:hypothetical protein